MKNQKPIMIKTEEGQRYILTEFFMVPYDIPYEGTQITTRREVNAVIQHKADRVNYAWVWVEGSGATVAKMSFNDASVFPHQIELGCKNFAGKNARILRKWARAYRP